MAPLSRAMSFLDRISPSKPVTTIAIDNDKNSQFAVKWAVDNLMNRHTSSQCVLLHVQTNSSHRAHHAADVCSREGRPPTEIELKQLFLHYRGICARKGIEAKEVVLHDDDVANALLLYIVQNAIPNIVVGASSCRGFLRKLKEGDIPSSLMRGSPESCVIYVISKTKVHVHDSRSTSRQHYPHTPSLPRQSSLESLLMSLIHHTNSHSVPEQICKSPHHDSEDNMSVAQTLESETSSSITRSYQTCDSTSSASFNPNFWETSKVSSNNSKQLLSSSSSTMDTHGIDPKDVTEIKEEPVQVPHSPEHAIVAAEEQRIKVATDVIQKARDLLDIKGMEADMVELADELDDQFDDEREISTYEGDNDTSAFRRYNIDEIEAATNHFSSSQKIGEGGYGSVFKGKLDNHLVAIKVLRPDLSQGEKQFKQEVEVLSNMKHPNLVRLLGSCAEYGCLIYEYMENGSLEDCLSRKDDSPPLSWRTRFRISAEVATGLLFLHQKQPEPIVHRDLKPGNILIGRDYVSKIGDVGLARLVPPTMNDDVPTMYQLTAARGTFYYIDPEYQSTGMLGVKSDLYSLGVMLLQMITGKSPVGIACLVEEAIEDGNLAEVLDPMVSDWPLEEALSLAKLALQCCELRKKDRPELATEVLPELNRLKDLAHVRD